MLRMSIYGRLQAKNPGRFERPHPQKYCFYPSLKNALWFCSIFSDNGRLLNSFTALYWTCFERKKEEVD